MLAVTHAPSPKMEQGQRTYVPQAAIDVGRAVLQHEQYCDMLRKCGADVRTLDVNRNLPDCVFVEDTAIVLDELAVLASMGTESRRAEPAGIEAELSRYREVKRIELPAKIEGGDVLHVGRTLLVGLSQRTNAAGIEALDRIVHRFGYRAEAIPVHGCLHLKTACTHLDGKKLLINPEWVDVACLGEYELIPVPDGEPWAANILRIHKTVLVSAAHRRTVELLQTMGNDVATLDLSEFAKAEGGVTCMSVLI